MWEMGRTGKLIVGALARILPAVAFVNAAPGIAELGGMMPSIQADQSHMRAALRQVPLASHVRHELALPNGGTVHEYTNPQGQVFAIRWSGPGKPDLRSLLGSHFATFQAGNASQPGRFGRFSRRPLMVDDAGLRVESGGHMGFFWGLAWLPGLMPAGVQPGDLQ